MKKLIWLIIIVVVIVGIVLIVNNNDVEEEIVKDEIKIGAVLPITGVISYLGDELKNGMELANMEEKLDITIEDSAASPKDGASAFNKLIDVDGVDINVVALSSVAGAVTPIADTKQIPVIHSVVSASGVAAQSDYVFRYFTSGAQEAPVMAKYAMDEIGLKTFAQIYLNDEYGLSYSEAFTDYITTGGGEISIEEIFNREDNDFRTQLAKIKAINPDAIYITGYDNHIVKIIAQCRELDIESELLTNWIMANPKNQENSGEDLNGVYFTTPDYYLEEKSDYTKDFIANYTEEFGRAPSAYAGMAYDVVKILATVKKSDNLLEDLKKVSNFESTMGSISVDKDGEFIFPLYPARMVNQKVEVYK